MRFTSRLPLGELGSHGLGRPLCWVKTWLWNGLLESLEGVCAASSSTLPSGRPVVLLTAFVAKDLAQVVQTSLGDTNVAFVPAILLSTADPLANRSQHLALPHL